MANIYLKISDETSNLEVGVEQEYLKISIENPETQNISSILLDREEVEELMEFIEKKKKEL